MISLRRLSAAVALLPILTLVTAPAVTAQTPDEIGISRGAAAPPAEVEDLDGNVVDLGDYIGKRPVLLEFWATWCEKCAALAPRMEAAYQEYSDRVEFLAIGVGVGQSPRSIKRHFRRHPSSIPTLYDARGAASRAYKAPTTSYIVIVDAAGKVAYTGVGVDQDIDAAVRGVLETD